MPTKSFVVWTEPPVRDGGVLRPASWTRPRSGRIGFHDIVTQHGGDVLGSSCSKSTNEMNYLAQKLARARAWHAQHR